MIKRIFILTTSVVCCLAVGTYYCYFHFQFWTHYKTENFESLTDYNGTNILGRYGRQILIHKSFERYVKKIDAYADKHDILLLVNQAFRYEEHRLGRTVVKPARLSNHQAGFAIDFNIQYNGEMYFADDLHKKNLYRLPTSVQKFISQIQKDKVLRWGGDFQPSDPIHIDVPLNIMNVEEWQRYKTACNKDYRHRVWKWKFW
jgi:hypothetical protein